MGPGRWCSPPVSWIAQTPPASSPSKVLKTKRVKGRRSRADAKSCSLTFTNQFCELVCGRICREEMILLIEGGIVNVSEIGRQMRDVECLGDGRIDFNVFGSAVTFGNLANEFGCAWPSPKHPRSSEPFLGSLAISTCCPDGHAENVICAIIRNAPKGLRHKLLVKFKPTASASKAPSDDYCRSTAGERINNDATGRACRPNKKLRQSFRHRSGVGDAAMLIIGLRH